MSEFPTQHDVMQSLQSARQAQRARWSVGYGSTPRQPATAPNTVQDEDYFSLNDASFGVGMMAGEWIDWPGMYYNNGCGFAFADGHSEIHKWKDLRTKVVGGYVARKSVPGSVDWLWIAERTTSK